MATTRLSIRHRKRLRVTIGATPLFTSDIGAGGFGAEAMRVQEPGTPVRGVIHINGGEVPYVGEVAWARAGVPHIALRGRMGVKFTSLPSHVMMLLSAPVLTATN